MGRVEVVHESPPVPWDCVLLAMACRLWAVVERGGEGVLTSFHRHGGR